VFTVIKAGGGIGVQFFFVLSGFLITYIIYEEKQQTEKLNLKNFFLRRILRIWPLFYLMIGVAFITPYLLSHLPIGSSQEGYRPVWWMSLLFLENYKMMIEGQDPNVSPLNVMWSLCVEEHFYILWGILLYYTSLKNLPKLIGFFLCLALAARMIYVHFHLSTIDIFTNIDLFAYGAIPAYLLLYKRDWLDRKIANISVRWKQVFVVVLLIVVFLASQNANDDASVFLSCLLGALFSLLIIFTLPLRNSLKIKDKNVLTRLGLYTYGFYLYHTLVLNLFKQLFAKMGWGLDEVKYIVLYAVTSFVLTMGISMLSYHLFEKHFLKLKRYFRS
jgi:peptidoglycan/LPS O-acetylase OafA/YrhL